MLMKAINYRKKKLNRFVYSSKEALENWKHPKYVLHLQKERQLWQKFIFREKPVSRPVRS